MNPVESNKLDWAPLMDKLYNCHCRCGTVYVSPVVEIEHAGLLSYRACPDCKSKTRITGIQRNYTENWQISSSGEME